MNKLQKIFGGKKELCAFLIILVLSILLRFINYDNRFGLASDQARDLLIVRETINIHTLPLIGPFSASGPFIFGPFWYWIFTIPVFLFPHTFIAPWVFQSILYVCAIVIIFFVGKEIHGKNFGLLLSLFTAVSSSEIKLSTNLIFSALVGFLSFIIIYFFVRYIKHKKLRDFLILSFVTAIAINIHFEAIPLVFFILFAVIFGKKTISHYIAAFILFLLPFIPLLIFNIKSHNYELSHITHFHQKIPSGLSALQFIKAEIGPIDFYPRIWGDTIGGSTIVGWLMIAAFVITILFIFIKKKDREDKIFAGVFILILISLVSYERRLFENFLGYLFPVMILFTGLACYHLARLKRVVGIFVISIIVFLSLLSDVQIISHASNTAFTTAQFWEENLTQKLPQQKFAVYDYQSTNLDKSLPLSLLLDVDGKTDENGFKIGVASFGAPVNHTVLIDGPKGPPALRLYNLQGTSNTELKKENFTPLNKSNVYDSVEKWYK